MTNIKNAPEVLARARAMLAAHPLLGASEETACERLLEQATFLRLVEGEAVFRQRQPAEHWYLVLEGRIDTLRYGIDGEERVIQHVDSGQLLAPIVMFMPQRRYPVDTRAALPSLVCQMRRENLHRACLEQPALALGMLGIAGEVLSLRIDDVDSLASCSAPQRLAAYLLRLPRTPDGCVALPLSQRQLAAKLGIRAETLNRLLAEWQKQGYLQGKCRRWRLAAPQELAALAQGGEAGA